MTRNEAFKNPVHYVELAQIVTLITLQACAAAVEFCTVLYSRASDLECLLLLLVLCSLHKTLTECCIILSFAITTHECLHAALVMCMHCTSDDACLYVLCQGLHAWHIWYKQSAYWLAEACQLPLLLMQTILMQLQPATIATLPHPGTPSAQALGTALAKP